MRLVAVSSALVVAIAACGVRTPAPLDVGALVRARGEAGARVELAARIADDPRDVQARLALATLADQAGRPSEAIDQLETVDRIGGPAGTRWHDEDRSRLARLVLARGRARLLRGAPSALTDFERAAQLGAPPAEDELRMAKLLVALAKVRHSDTRTRTEGRSALVHLLAHADTPALAVGREPMAPTPTTGPSTGPSRATDDPASTSLAKPLPPAYDVRVEDAAQFGIWLWKRGAKRAAWEELSRWHDGPRGALDQPASDTAALDAYLIAYAWWTPYDGPPPEMHDLAGPERCRWLEAPGCAPGEVEPAAQASLVWSPPRAATTTADAGAWLAITLRAMLRGDAAWGPSFRARVDIAAIPIAEMPPARREAFAELAGRALPALERGSESPWLVTEDDRLVAAAARALRGGSYADVADALGPLAQSAEGARLLAIASPPDGTGAAGGALPPPSDTTGMAPDAAATEAIVALVRARVPEGVEVRGVRAVLSGYAQDPLVADRVGRDLVAAAVDAAPAYASLGAIFDAVGDPARARAAWQAAVDGSAEPAYLRGLAEAIAHTHDGDAALVAATGAAAWSGDPAVVWIAVADALVGAGAYQQALDAARFAIDLAGREQIAAAFEVAARASERAGRTTQAAELRARRETVAPPPPAAHIDDPTDGAAALAAHRAGPTAATTARLWWASRWSLRDVELRAALLEALGAADRRRAAVVAELVALAGDPTLGPEVVRALRQRE